MASGDHYRARARECIEAADRTSEPERKLTLLELAQRWMRLAEQVDTIRDESGLRGNALLDGPKPDKLTH
jgi:hypothetical protein